MLSLGTERARMDDLRVMLERFLAAAGLEGMTLSEVRERDGMQFERLEEMRAITQELESEGRVVVRGQSDGYSVFVWTGAPHLTSSGTNPRRCRDGSGARRRDRRGSARRFLVGPGPVDLGTVVALALLPRSRSVGGGRRPGAAGALERDLGRQRRLEDRDPRPRALEPDRLGRHRVSDHRRQQPGEADFKHGLYGDGAASTDRSEQEWRLLALDLATGEVRWQRTAHRGVPRDKRHIKATYANATPATDGRVVVAHFGSEGVFAYSVAGERLWHRDLGRLDAGAYDAPSYEWGNASSPILHDGRVILQCDTQGGDFLLALDAESGETVWRTERDELPSWSTPTVVPGPQPELVTNAPNFIRGYDPRTGRELWRLGGSSKITAPTPIYEDDLIVVVSGRRPEKPIFVLRRGARGDITLAEPETSNHSVVWHRLRHGSYMPTPIVYDGLLYVCNNDGILGCYRLADGEQVYRERLPHIGGGFSGSPVAADGRLYLPNEDGEILVVRAGEKLELLARNPMGERLMASPALAGGKLLVRGQHHLFAIAAPGSDPAEH